MFKLIIEQYKVIDNSILKIMKIGLLFCFILSIISSLILFTYIYFLKSLHMYYLGINLFKLSLTFGIEFIICAFVVDFLKKELV